MGKAGRIVCIVTPWALTIASFICLILIEVSGWSRSSSLTHLYFFDANFTGLDLASAGTLANTTTLTTALDYARREDLLRDIYQIHLWNYCTSNQTDGQIDWCSKRHKNYYFDPLTVWGLNSTNTTSATATSAGDNAVAAALASQEDALRDKAESLENEMLGESGREAFDAYRKVSKWMFIAYQVSFWTTLATLACGLLAIFSRWGSLLTWLLSIVSTIFTFGAVLTSTILFSVLVGALDTLLDPYHVDLSLGTHALVVTWLAVAFSVAATLFWLFSTCCCSGRSNPHHKSNKGGLWAAEPKGQGYGDYGRGRALRVEKTGGGYERVASPWLGHAEDENGDRVPLNQYPAGSGAHAREQDSGAYEPYRHT
ncbi:SUR7/PalI family [Teratosphaeria destructans]|uniref:SUR7/PalI family n=1 Tax=Teratosphaeria destructans TaxID=418781 RepID=A0A9W7SQJ3_9PEZI|nr:SUR7/PalI family [Teratosphaeria destructans]